VFVQVNGFAEVQRLNEIAAEVMADCAAEARRRLGGRLSTPSVWIVDEDALREWLLRHTPYWPPGRSDTQFAAWIVRLLDSWCKCRIKPIESPAPGHRTASYSPDRFNQQPRCEDELYRDLGPEADLNFEPRSVSGGY
jgi:hypothetical protein